MTCAMTTPVLMRRRMPCIPATVSLWGYEYDWTDAANFEEVTGAIATSYNLGSVGAAGNLVQETAARRAAVNVGGAYFDGVDDFTPAPVFIPTLQAGEFEIDVGFLPDADCPNSMILTMYPASGSGYFQLFYLAGTSLRIVARNASNAVINQYDLGTTGIGTGGFVNGVSHRVALRQSAGSMQMSYGGAVVDTGAFNWAGSNWTPTACAIGAILTGAGGTSSRFKGVISDFKLRGV